MGCGASKDPEKKQSTATKDTKPEEQTATHGTSDNGAKPSTEASTRQQPTGNSTGPTVAPAAAVAAVAGVSSPAPQRGSSFEPNPAQNSAEVCTVTATVWTPNEKFFLSSDEQGRVTCWSAFVPYQRKWCKAVPRVAGKQTCPSVMALLTNPRLDTAGAVLAVDNVSNAWTLDINSGATDHLGNLRDATTGATFAAVCTSSTADTANAVFLFAAHSKGTVTAHSVDVSVSPSGARKAVSVALITLPNASGCDATALAILDGSASPTVTLFVGTTDGRLFLVSVDITAGSSTATVKPVPGFTLRACVMSMFVTQVLTPKRLVVLDDGGRVSVWSVPTGSLEDEAASAKQLSTRSVEATTISVSRDDRYVFCYGLEPRSPILDILVIDLISALDPALSSTPPLATVGALNIAELLRSGSSAKDEKTSKFDTLAVPCVAQSVNGLILLAGTGQSQVAMLDLSEFVKPDVIMHHRGSTVGSLTIAGGGGKFGVSASEDTTIKVWELLSGRPVASMTAHTGRIWSVTSLKFGPHTTPSAGGGIKSGVATTAPPVWIASGAEDGTMRLWALPTGKQLEVHAADRDCVWAVASEDGAIYTGGADGVIRVWVMEGHPYSSSNTQEAKEAVSKFSEDESRMSFVGGLRLSGNNLKRSVKSGATAASSKFSCWAKLEGHTAAVCTLHTIPYIGHPNTSANVLLVSGSFDTTIRVWHMPSCRCIASLSNIHSDVVWSICSAAALHPRCKIDPALIPVADADTAESSIDYVKVFSASEDRTVQCYDLNLTAAVSVEARTTSNMSVLERVATYDSDVPVASIALLDALHVACGTANGTLVALEVSTAMERVVGKYAGAQSLVPVFFANGVHPGNSSICSMVSTKHCLLTGGVDGTIRYHSPWPALRECSSEGGGNLSMMQRKARLVMLHLAM